jgi:hypothetical protein
MTWRQFMMLLDQLAQYAFEQTKTVAKWRRLMC